MKLTSTLILASGLAGLINATTDTTITETVTITKTLYTPEESLSMAEEAAKAASIASLLSVESQASVAAAQLAVDGYYRSLASASEALLVQETAALGSKGYNATNNITIHYVTVTMKPKSEATSSASETLTLETESTNDASDSSLSEAVTIPAEETSKGAGIRLLNGQYTGAIAGLCAVVAALL